jgi:hypothetical protein
MSQLVVETEDEQNLAEELNIHCQLILQKAFIDATKRNK